MLTRVPPHAPSQAQKTIRDGFGVAMTLSFLREVRHMLSEAHRRGSQRYRVDSVNYDQHAFGLTGFAEAVDTVRGSVTEHDKTMCTPAIARGAS